MVCRSASWVALYGLGGSTCRVGHSSEIEYEPQRGLANESEGLVESASSGVESYSFLSIGHSDPQTQDIRASLQPANWSCHHKHSANRPAYSFPAIKEYYIV